MSQIKSNLYVTISKDKQILFRNRYQYDVSSDKNTINYPIMKKATSYDTALYLFSLAAMLSEWNSLNDHEDFSDL